MYLVTGATGFIGRHLIQQLSNEKVACLVRNEKNIRFLNKPNIKIAYGSLEYKKSLEEATKNVTCIIHLAAETRSRNKEDKYRVNVEGTRNLLEVAKKNKVKRFIYMSSYRASQEAHDDYGKSKFLAEKLVESSGLDYIILKPTMVYGKDDRNTTPLIKRIKQLPIIPLFGNGNFKTQPIYVEDVCQATVHAAQFIHIKNKTYYLPGPQLISFNEYTKLIINALSRKRLTIKLPLPVLLVLLKLYGTLTRKTVLDVTDIKRLMSYHYLNPEPAVKDLKIKQTMPAEGIKKTVQ